MEVAGEQQCRVIRMEVAHFSADRWCFMRIRHTLEPVRQPPVSSRRRFVLFRPRYHRSSAIFRSVVSLPVSTTLPPHPLLYWQSDWTTITATSGYGGRSTWRALTVSLRPWRAAATHPRAVGHGPGQPTPVTVFRPVCVCVRVRCQHKPMVSSLHYSTPSHTSTN